MIQKAKSKSETKVPNFKKRNYKLGGIKPYAQKLSREIKFKLNVQNPKLIFQVISSANCWEYISELKIDFPYQEL